MRIGVLTGGGDCPGLNAVIRAVVTKGSNTYGHEFVGFLDGWRGAVEGRTSVLDTDRVAGILDIGGTILGSSRTNPYSIDGAVEQIRGTLADQGVDALIALGGEDTLGVARRLTADGIGVVGVPKTIDNDLSATDYTFGFDTAVGIATEAVDRVRTTAQSHHRAIVIEVMGRHAGWIALHTGMASGANVVLIPEQEFDVDQVCGWALSCSKRGVAPLIVTAEGALPKGSQGASQIASGTDSFGHARLGGIGEWLAAKVEAGTGIETRHLVLGHLQRGGSPTAYDRVLSTRLGLHAIDAAHERDFGTMVALRGTEIVRVSLEEATGELKTVPPQRYAEVAAFFG